MTLLNVMPTGTPGQFHLLVTPQICVGHPDTLFMFGGAGLGAGLTAIEAVTGRETVWAAAQYLSYARPGDDLLLDVQVPVSGKNTSQARVTIRTADKEILTVNVALGARPGSPEAQWAQMPEVAAPADCPPMIYDWVRREDDINGSFAKRVATGRVGDARKIGGPSPDGVFRIWVRPVSGDVDRIMLALIADFLPSAIGHALGGNAGGNSLDNTIRFARIAATEWVLADIRIHAASQGFVHGRVHLFAQDGTLLATASQSMILRSH